MKIWIDDIQGYLDGYSTMEQPNKIELEVEKEPTDFFNYRWDGTSLIYDPDNVPEPEPHHQPTLRYYKPKMRN
ncbi:hypothetical protein O996_02885 [Enterococcus faecalis BM4654]|nr:hypothetical protein O996_02885 [Enterococcus faecalis BM4654]